MFTTGGWGISLLSYTCHSNLGKTNLENRFPKKQLGTHEKTNFPVKDGKCYICNIVTTNYKRQVGIRVELLLVGKKSNFNSRFKLKLITAYHL